MSGKSHGLVFELLGYVPWTASGDFDPGLGEDSADGNDKSDVDGGMEGVLEGCSDTVRSRDIVGDTGSRAEL